MRERRVQSLVGKLRFHMLQEQLSLSAAKNKKSLEKKQNKALPIKNKVLTWE